MIAKLTSNVKSLTGYCFVCTINAMFNKVEGEKSVRKIITYSLLGVVFAVIVSLALPSKTGSTQSLHVSPNAVAPSFTRLENIKIVEAEKKNYAKNEQLSPEELRDMLSSVGFRGEALVQAWGVAMKESTGRPRSHNKNNNTGDNSYGLFQINMIGSLGPARLEKYGLESNKDLFDPVRNAKIAYQMSDGGKNWSAWGGMTDKTVYWMSEFPD
jgi:hypothetical protein